MANELGEHIFWLRICRKVDAEFRQLQQVTHHAFFEHAMISYAVRGARARRKQVLGVEHSRVKQSARGFVHGQSAQTMAKEREWLVQQRSHLGYELIDKLIHVGDRGLGNPSEATGWLDCNNLNCWIDELSPIPVNGGASAGEWKAKQPKPRSVSRTDGDEP